MLHSITWLRFCGFLFLGLVIYYGYVLIRFFGREVRDFARWRKMQGQEPPWDTSEEVPGKGPGGSVGTGDRGMVSGRQAVDQGRTGPTSAKAGMVNAGQTLRPAHMAGAAGTMGLATQGEQQGAFGPGGNAGNFGQIGNGEPSDHQWVSDGAGPGGPDNQERPDGLNGMMVRPGPGTDDQTPELFKVMERAIARLRELSVDWSLTAIRREELEEEIQRILSSYGQLKRTPYQIAINNFLVRICKMHFATELTEEDLTRLWGG